MLSLTNFIKNSEHEVSRPIICANQNNDNAFIEIINGIHPCLTKTFSGSYIPNDVVLGCKVIIIFYKILEF